MALERRSSNFLLVYIKPSNEHDKYISLEPSIDFV